MQHVRILEISRDHTYAYTSLVIHKDRMLLSYNLESRQSGRSSNRFRSLPMRRFYEDQ